MEAAEFVLVLVAAVVILMGLPLLFDGGKQ